MEIIDINGDNRISKDEFTTWFLNGSQGGQMGGYILKMIAAKYQVADYLMGIKDMID